MNSAEAIISAIRKKIKFERTNSLRNHFLTIVRHNFEGYSGETASDQFIVWRYNSWSGVFYPVIIGKIELSEGKHKLMLKSRMNPFGMLMACIILAFTAYAIIFGVILQIDNSWTYVWKRILLGLVVFSIPVMTIFLLYTNQRREELESVKKMGLQKP